MAALSDPIGDFLIRIKNASRAGLEVCDAPYSKVKIEIARILKEEGYIWNFEINKSGKFPVIEVKVKYDGVTPVLTDVKRMSRPGRRQFVGVDAIPRVLGGLGISILSTSRGIMTGHKARRENVGGELIAKVW